MYALKNKNFIKKYFNNFMFKIIGKKKRYICIILFLFKLKYRINIFPSQKPIILIKN